jgi:hypothetical protein
MGLRRSLIFLWFIMCGSGCSMYSNLAHDAVFEAKRCTDETFERIHNRKLANAAWQEVEYSSDRGFYSDDYARGFKDGYADYLFAGGKGEAPPMLPECYWGVRYQTPQGYQAIQDWFNGFRHGTVSAQQSGNRELMIFPVPYSDPDLTAYHPYPVPPGSPLPLMAPQPRMLDQSANHPAAASPPMGKAPEMPPPRPVSTILEMHGASTKQPANSIHAPGLNSAEKVKHDAGALLTPNSLPAENTERTVGRPVWGN